MAGADLKLWFWPRRFKLDFLTVSVVVAGAYYSLSHCAAATGRLVPGSIPDKRENLFLPLLLVVAPPTRCGFESRPASNPCVAARLAQMVERMTLNHVVAGSIPAVGAVNFLPPPVQ